MNAAGADVIAASNQRCAVTSLYRIWVEQLTELISLGTLAKTVN